MTTPILEINDLTITYQVGKQALEAVRNFSLTIDAGQTVGLVGESGSGKSTVALAVMRYLSQGGSVASGSIRFKGRDLLGISMAEMRTLWGRDIALVPQDPFSALNPSIRIREQLAEPLRQHRDMNQGAANQRAVELLDMVRIPDPERVANSYPHQISGGMQQRVMIAMALSTEPSLLVLDEPTTALDVTTQAAVLDLLADLISARDAAVLYVTHNLGVVAQVSDRVAVLYAGELVEAGATGRLFTQPIHPYTQGLLASVPQLGQNKHRIQLRAIPGRIPALKDRVGACVFAPRCPLAIDVCHTDRPPLTPASPTTQVRCHRWEEINDGSAIALPESETQAVASNDAQVESATVLDLEDVEVHFATGRSLTQLINRDEAPKIRAVDGVSIKLGRGKTLGVVGESGSGKTTLARAIIGLYERTGGDIELLGSELPTSIGGRDLTTLKQLQYIFQNPDEALNPYLSVGETLRRPLMTLLGLSQAEADARVSKLLTSVSLPPEYASRRPRQLSGGEKQRVAIARAFASAPTLLLADEPVSALDVSVQAAVLNLLRDLQRDNQNTLLFISHDLAVVGYLADEIAVMYVGNLMELASADGLFEPPYHPYTEALLSAIPDMTPGAQKEPIRLEGDVPTQMARPSGCPFHPRCPRYLGDICRDEVPPWQQTADGNYIFCHIPLDELAAAQRAPEAA